MASETRAHQRWPAGAEWVAQMAGPLAVLALLAALMTRHGRLPYPDARFPYDQYTYIAMAQHPLNAGALLGATLPRIAPYCWRLLTPLLVHVLPMPVLSGFWVVTVGSL